MAFTQARVDAALDAALATTTHAQLHTGDPGAAGTANVAAGIDRATASFPAASAGESEALASFAVTAGGPYSHVSLWTAATGGTHTGNGALTPAETFAGPGTLDVTITATATS